MKQKSFDELVAGIYQCPGDAAAWSRLALQLGSLFAAEHVHFVLFDAAGKVAAEAASDRDAGREYALHYAHRDMAVPRVMGSASGTALWSHRLLSADELARCPVQNELLPRVNVSSRSWVHTPFDGRGTFSTTILHARRRAGLDATQSRRLEMVHQHLHRAMQLDRTLEALRERQRWLETGLDAVGCGVILVDGGGMVLFANRAATAPRQRALTLGHRVHANAPAHDALLQRLLAAALPRSGAPKGGTADLGGLRVSVIPVSQRGKIFEDRVAAVILLPDAATPRDPAPLLNAGLTAAEAALALAVASGETLDSYAARTGRTLGTVRAQLRAVFAKTDTHRQSELVLHVLGITRGDRR